VVPVAQDFVREIVAQGNVRNMVRTLAVLAAAEKRKQAKADGDASPAATGKAILIHVAFRWQCDGIDVARTI
jgi:hypothetical protein